MAMIRGRTFGIPGRARRLWDGGCAASRYLGIDVGEAAGAPDLDSSEVWVTPNIKGRCFPLPLSSPYSG